METQNRQQAIDVWDKVMRLLEKELSSVSIERWFRNLLPFEISQESLVIDVPDEFFKKWVEDHYTEHILSALKRSGAGLSSFCLRVVPRSAATQAALAPSHPAEPKIFSPVPDRRVFLNLNEQYTFDEFVVGPSNRFAHAASLAVADQPAKIYNPLFIHGPVGLGKTHLMQAIGHRLLKQNPSATVLYLTSERFTNDLIGAIQTQSTSRFRDKFRNVDILLIDDIHFIGGKEATQEEFFHTFNALYDNHRQIVVSSDRPPKDINNLEERLVSRFEWGLVTDIQKPDFETRSAIVRKKAQRQGMPIPDEVTNFIAEVILSNIRELEGALMRVVAYARLLDRPVTLSLAQEVLHRAIVDTQKKLSIGIIQQKVSDYFSIRPSEMTAKKRSRNVVLPRQIAMFLTRELTDFSLPEIGSAFGGRDHTTVIHACDKIRKVVEKDADMRDTVDRIRKGLRD